MNRNEYFVKVCKAIIAYQHWDERCNWLILTADTVSIQSSLPRADQHNLPWELRGRNIDQIFVNTSWLEIWMLCTLAEKELTRREDN